MEVLNVNPFPPEGLVVEFKMRPGDDGRDISDLLALLEQQLRTPFSTLRKKSGLLPYFAGGAELHVGASADPSDGGAGAGAAAAGGPAEMAVQTEEVDIEGIPTPRLYSLPADL